MACPVDPGLMKATLKKEKMMTKISLSNPWLWTRAFLTPYVPLALRVCLLFVCRV